MRMRPVPLLVAAAAALVVVTLHAAAPTTRGHVGLSLLLRKLATVGTVMHATAHPDDENNALLARQSHGEGLRVVLATATRGNGGQNEIGPELFEALGVLRTEELASAHAFDGAEQLFARAVDFGFSFSIEESFEKWGKDEIVGDFVRLIRQVRPDVIVAMRPDGAGGGQHHQASGRLAAEAFRLAGDPSRYPEQLQAGLRAWQPRKVYQARWYGMFPGDKAPAPDEKLVTVDGNEYDPLLGRTWAEIGSEARAMHKSQGFGQLLALPGPFIVKYRLVDSTVPGAAERQERSLTDGLDLSLAGLAAFAGAAPPARLRGELQSIAGSVESAGRALQTGGSGAAVAPLARGLQQARALREWVGSAGSIAADAAFEIGFRLDRTIATFEQALVVAQGLRLEALAEDGVVVPGQAVKLRLIAANAGAVPIAWRGVVLSGFGGEPSACGPADITPGGVQACEPSVTVSVDARTTEPYWRREGEAGRYTFEADAPFGQPFRPTPFLAAFDLAIGGVPVRVTQPIVHRYEGNIFSGEKRMELHVVPALTVRVQPEIAIVPLADRARADASEPTAREIRVTVTNHAPGAAEADVRLQLPEGWTASPATAPVRFARADEATTLRFAVTPPPAAAAGQFRVQATAQSAGGRFDRGFEVIEYPHTRRRHIFGAAEAVIKLIDVRLPERLRVGYVMGVGDQVPPALQQIGAEVQLLGADDLAWADLSGFDAIVTGVRAYERREDLRANNHRLIEYARTGGTVVVQYNKFEFNRSQYGPYPAKVSANRVTDEHSPVTVLVPRHPVFNTPNLVDGRAWQGWVQERGLYFLGERDAQYVDLVELSDPFPYNEGPKRGALVEARVGKGRWVYVGLGLWRQLPAGTEGAYRLLANIVSLGRTGGER